MSAVKTVKDRVSLHAAYKRVFNVESGDVRKVLKHLCKVAHVMEPTFVEGKPDLSAFHEGQRHIVVSLLNYINKDTDKLLEQLRQLEHETDA